MNKFLLTISFLAALMIGSVALGHDGHYGHYYGQYYGGTVVVAPRVYVAPAPVYVAPAPVYVAPTYYYDYYTGQYYYISDGVRVYVQGGVQLRTRGFGLNIGW